MAIRRRHGDIYAFKKVRLLQRLYFENDLDSYTLIVIKKYSVVFQKLSNRCITISNKS